MSFICNSEVCLGSGVQDVGESSGALLQCGEKASYGGKTAAVTVKTAGGGQWKVLSLCFSGGLGPQAVGGYCEMAYSQLCMIT